MANWTDIYKNPQTQAMFGSAVPPIPSIQVPPIGGWNNVDVAEAMRQMVNKPQPQATPQVAPQVAPDAGQEQSGLGGLGSLLMLLPLFLASQAKHPNRARSAYMAGIMQMMQQQKALQQQKAQEQREMQMTEQERRYNLARDLFKALSQENPNVLYDAELIGYVQAGDFEGMRSYINQNREALLPPKEEEPIDYEETAKQRIWQKYMEKGFNALTPQEQKVVGAYITPPSPTKPNRPSYTGKFTDSRGRVWVYDPKNPDDRRLLGEEPPEGISRTDTHSIRTEILGGTDLYSKITKEGLVNQYQSPQEMEAVIAQMYGRGTEYYKQAMGYAFNDPMSPFYGADPRNQDPAGAGGVQTFLYDPQSGGLQPQW